MKVKNIAGMSMTGGRKDNFFFCLLEHYPNEDRWFLKSFLQVKDEEGLVGNEAIHSWIEEYHISRMVIDFPLSSPACQSCALACPGEKQCPDATVINVRRRLDKLLEEDKLIHGNSPKNYERNRNIDDEVSYSKDILKKKTKDHILSRPFKRKLKKGFLPYWNRPVDFWVWENYYDQMLELFKSVYDSFGNTSLMTLSRFHYLKRHFPHNLMLHEAEVNIILIELLRAKIILKKDILAMNDIEFGFEARLNIIKKIEAKLSIFIYDHDLEVLVKNPRAFSSFLLALAGQRIILDKICELPTWTLAEQSSFVIPHF